MEAPCSKRTDKLTSAGRALKQTIAELCLTRSPPARTFELMVSRATLRHRRSVSHVDARRDLQTSNLSECGAFC